MFVKLISAGAFLLISLSVYSQDIFEASREGKTKRISELIKLNSDTVNATNAQGFNPLMIACYRGQTKAAKLLVSKGANVNTSSPEGSALQAAVYQNNTELALFLIKNGADLGKTGPDGNNALMYAVLNQNEKLVKQLVQSGSDLTAINNDGQTAHSLAITQENKSIQLITEIK